MNDLKRSLQRDVPLVAVGFADKTPLYQISEAIKCGLDVAELRIDLYSSFDCAYVLREVRKFKNLPTVATIRIKREGGNWSGSDSDRLSLFRALINEVNAVDVELASKSILSQVAALAHAANKLVFVSYHNFDSTPKLSTLNGIARKAKAAGADIVKMATFAKNKKDLQTLAMFTIENSDLGVVSIAMGSKGVVSRLFFPALGSRLTYAYMGKITAPGQLHFDETSELMRKCYPEFNQKKIVSLKLLEAA